MMALLAAMCVGLNIASIAAIVAGHRSAKRPSPTGGTAAEPAAVVRFLEQEPRLSVVSRLVYGFAVGFPAILFLSLALRSLALAFPIALAIAVAGPEVHSSRRRAHWRRKRLQAWPEALREVVAGLLSARSLHQSLTGLAERGPEVLRPVWRHYGSLAQTLDAHRALEALRDELGDPVSDRVLEMLIVAFDAGPAAMLDILRDMADSINEDVQLSRRVEVANTEQRLNGWIVMALPTVFLILVNFLAPSFRNFYNSGGGFVVVAVGTMLSSIGLVIVTRLGRIPTEPRMFGRSTA